MKENEIGKFKEGEGTSKRRGSENFMGMREEKSGCEINTREGRNCGRQKYRRWGSESLRVQ